MFPYLLIHEVPQRPFKAMFAIDHSLSTEHFLGFLESFLKQSSEGMGSFGGGNMFSLSEEVVI